MSASIDIDEIDDIELMSELMKSRGLSSRGLQTLDQMKQRAKKALTISEKVRMKHLWLRIDSNSGCTDIAILSLNYQELIALKTGPMAMRNGEVIVRNYRQAVLWPAFYMSRLKIGLFTDTVRNSEPKGNQWPPITLLVVNWLSNQTFTPDLKLLNYTARAPCSTFIISLFHAYITKRNHLGGWNLIIRLARFNGHNLNCIQSSCRRKRKCLVC